MGSIEDWNAIRTRKAAEELVEHARADELRRQGLIGPADGVAEARAYDQRVRDENRSGAATLVMCLAVLAGCALLIWFIVAVISTALS